MQVRAPARPKASMEIVVWRGGRAYTPARFRRMRGREELRKGRLWTALGYFLPWFDPSIYTSAGEAIVADLIDGTSAVHYDGTNGHIEWGLGSTAPAKGDTDIETTTSEARVNVTASQPAADTNQAVATITADGTKTITEAAWFNSLTVGSMLVRGTFTAIPVVLNDQITFTISLQQA